MLSFLLPKKRISSCTQCKTVCCKFGPGPYEVLEPEDFTGSWCDSGNYNTKCSGLADSGGCKYWNMPNLPMECRTFICQIRLFSKEELESVEKVLDEECPTCDRGWIDSKESKDGHSYTRFCTVCGWEQEWELKNEKLGNSRFKSTST